MYHCGSADTRHIFIWIDQLWLRLINFNKLWLTHNANIVFCFSAPTDSEFSVVKHCKSKTKTLDQCTFAIDSLYYRGLWQKCTGPPCTSLFAWVHCICATWIQMFNRVPCKHPSWNRCGSYVSLSCWDYVGNIRTSNKAIATSIPRGHFHGKITKHFHMFSHVSQHDRLT